MSDVVARFDSLGHGGGGRSFLFRRPRRVVEAWSVDGVLPALRDVEAAVADGLHAAGFVAYEAAPGLDPALATHPPDPRLPLVRFVLCEERVETEPPAEEGDGDAGAFDLGAFSPALAEDEYAAAIDRIRELIAAGDSYQVNFTFPLRASFAGDGEALYRRLCRAQRADFCAYLRFGETSIVSASPELFFSQQGHELELRPMKGTRPRGRWPEEDARLAGELLSSAKERAENLMIVDLLRNDAGRVAEFGSVRVDRLFQVERYETVHQLTSTIRARARADVGLADLFGALFPCGSVTGAPKVRTSEIIAGLERGPRGVYTGAVGFASPGEAVFSVAIRTLVIDHAAGTAELGVGSGVTFDSAAAAEYRECLDKAAFATHAPNDFRLLETLLWEPGDGFFLLDGHLERLARSAAYFGFRCGTDEARKELARNVEGDAPLRVRLAVGRDGRCQVEAHALDPSPDPVRVAVAREPVDSRTALLYHKTTRREIYRERKSSRSDADDVLLVNERGELTESTIANLVVEMDGARWTPPLECGLLPGVFRAELLRRGEVAERVLRPADLTRAEAVWLVSSVRRWRRAKLIE